MSELALYRKYRPAKFKDVVGQDHIVTVLDGAIKLGNIAHAYLFAGPRGTGKTSIARILAHELGCTNNDLVEIDAASNNGVNEIRELNEAVRTLPFESPYKVYIVDEVHMLSKSAFNALLKTLEEPPKHVIFILATTELNKLPETIVSRCQSFQFKKPQIDSLKKVILNISKKEGFSIDDETAGLIALLGDGSFRDTIGMLQKVIGFSKDKKISREEVETITGAPKISLIFDLIRALLDKKTPEALKTVSRVVAGEGDIKFYLRLVMDKIRLAMLAKYAPEMQKDIFEDVGSDEAKILKELLVHENINLLPKILRELLDVYDLAGRTYLPQVPLELAIVKLSAAQ